MGTPKGKISTKYGDKKKLGKFPNKGYDSGMIWYILWEVLCN